MLSFLLSVLPFLQWPANGFEISMQALKKVFSLDSGEHLQLQVQPRPRQKVAFHQDL